MAGAFFFVVLLIGQQFWRVWMPTFHRVNSTMTGSCFWGPPCVVVLFNTCRPSHIAGLVIPIVVDAINREFFRWSWTNVFKKCNETLAPALAHLNASATVVAIVASLWVVAALNHAAPDTGFMAIAHPVSFVVFEANAAAGIRTSDTQIVDVNLTRRATHASTQQIAKSMTSLGFRENSPIRNDRPWCNRASERGFVLTNHRSNSKGETRWM